MKTKFKKLSPKEETKLTKEEAIKYYEQKQEYYRKAPINNFYVTLVNSLRGYDKVKGPKGLIKVAEKRRDFEIVYLNDLEVPEEGYIVATNHKSFEDVPSLVEVVPEAFHWLSANDVKFSLEINFFFKLLGAVSFSRAKKNEKEWALEHFSKIVAKKRNKGAIFPEAVNNFVDPNLLYPFWPGIIDAAKNTNKPILPVATYNRDGKFYVKYGKPYTVNVWENRDYAAKKLEEYIATLLQEIKETFPTLSREELVSTHTPPNLSGAFTYNPEYERQFVYRRKNPYSVEGEREVHYDEAFANLVHLITYAEFIGNLYRGKVDKIEILQPRDKKDCFYIKGRLEIYAKTESFKINEEINTSLIEEIMNFAHKNNIEVVCHPCIEPFPTISKEVDSKDLNYPEYENYDIVEERNKLKKKLIEQRSALLEEDTNVYDKPTQLIKRLIVNSDDDVSAKSKL